MTTLCLLQNMLEYLKHIITCSVVVQLGFPTNEWLNLAHPRKIPSLAKIVLSVMYNNANLIMIIMMLLNS